MKAILIPILGMIGTFGLALLLARLIYIRRRREGRLTRRRFVVTSVLILLILYPIGGFIYFSIYIHAEDTALKYLESTETVKVTEIDDGYLFDGPGTRDAYVFYPGAKVDEKAYAQLMHMIAEEGIDCFLIKMPFHMAFFGKFSADDVRQNYSYDRWYVGGHSLGGAMAAVYGANRADGLSGLILMAAYSSEKIPDSLPVLSITATKDGVMNWGSYHDNESNFPPDTTEVSIEGGNHSQFGDYGTQAGDGEATITRDEQMRQTVAAIRAFQAD